MMHRKKLRGGGWFDKDRAEIVATEATEFDGHNMISLATGSQWEHEKLLRTANGRYVLDCWSQWQGSRETYEVLEPRAAAKWILECSAEDDLPADLAEYATIGEH